MKKTIVLLIFLFAMSFSGCSFISESTADLKNSEELLDGKYKITLEVTVEEHLLFGFSNADLYVDKHYIGTVKPGRSESLSVNLDEGKHTLKIQCADNPETFEEILFDVFCDNTLKYSITCDKSRIYFSDIEMYTVPIDNKHLNDIKIDEAEDLFSNAGFYFIDTIKIHDVTNDNPDDYGKVEEITINHTADFSMSYTYYESPKVVIKYHAHAKINIPKNHDELIGLNYTDVEKIFKDAGFNNVETYYHYTNEYAENSVYEIEIFGSGLPKKNEFTADNLIDPDSHITIKYALHSNAEEYQEPTTVDSSSYTYIINVMTMKFHRLSCGIGANGDERNIYYTTMTRDEVIAAGYSPCQKCNP